MRVASNVNIKSNEELDFINSKFTFELKDDYVLVHSTNFNRPTIHSVDKDFTIHYAKNKSMKINSAVIKLWGENFANSFISLVDVQNAYNVLRCGYMQEYTKEDILKVLNKIK